MSADENIPVAPVAAAPVAAATLRISRRCAENFFSPPRKFLTRQIALRPFAEKFDAPNCAAKLWKKL